MTDDEDKTLTAKEVCQIFGLGEKRLGELRKKGLPFISMDSGRRKYLRSDVRDFLKAMRETEAVK